MYRPADILACYGTAWCDVAIRIGTSRLIAPPRLRLGPSHVAMIIPHNRQLAWLESTSLCGHPCLLRHRKIRGVQLQWPHNRVRDYERVGGHVDIYRISPAWSFSKGELTLLRKIADHFLDDEIGYDLGGALLSGTRILQATSALPGVDLNQIFCSQLVAQLLMRLGRLNVDNARRFNPARLMRWLLKCGVYQFERRAGVCEPITISPDATQD